MSETKKLPQYLQLIVNIFSQELVFLNLLLFQLVLLKILLKVFSLICPLLGSLVIGSSSDSSVIVSSIGSLVIYKVLSRVLSDRVLSRVFSDRIIIRVLSNVLFWVHSDSVLLRQGRRKLFYFLWWGTENKCQPLWLTNEKK